MHERGFHTLKKEAIIYITEYLSGYSRVGILKNARNNIEEWGIKQKPIFGSTYLQVILNGINAFFRLSN